MTTITRSIYRYQPFDYRRECDRCGWAGWFRSDLSKEPVTGEIVCQYCWDEPWPRDLGIIRTYTRDFSYKID